MSDLTAKQALFVREYLIDLNATQAAIRAGYSKKTANEQGARLLAKASVKAAVAEASEKRADKLDLNAERVLKAIAEVAFGDVRKMFDENGALDMLARHHSLYNDKFEVTGLDALAERLARAAKRNG